MTSWQLGLLGGHELTTEVSRNQELFLVNIWDAGFWNLLHNHLVKPKTPSLPNHYTDTLADMHQKVSCVMLETLVSKKNTIPKYSVLLLPTYRAKMGR